MMSECIALEWHVVEWRPRDMRTEQTLRPAGLRILEIKIKLVCIRIQILSDDEVPIEVIPDVFDGAKEPEFEDAKAEPECMALLTEEKRRSAHYEDQWKRALADFDNQKRRMEEQIKGKVGEQFNRFMLDFLDVYDDFERARDSYKSDSIPTDGLDSVIRNMSSLLSKNGVRQVQALGNKFDPNMHEAISFREDDTLEEGTITKELRKGYISSDRIIRPSLVEISRKRVKNGG